MSEVPEVYDDRYRAEMAAWAERLAVVSADGRVPLGDTIQTAYRELLDLAASGLERGRIDPQTFLAVAKRFTEIPRKGCVPGRHQFSNDRFPDDPVLSKYEWCVHCGASREVDGDGA